MGIWGVMRPSHSPGLSVIGPLQWCLGALGAYLCEIHSRAFRCNKSVSFTHISSSSRWILSRSLYSSSQCVASLMQAVYVMALIAIRGRQKLCLARGKYSLECIRWMWIINNRKMIFMTFPPIKYDINVHMRDAGAKTCCCVIKRRTDQLRPRRPLRKDATNK